MVTSSDFRFCMLDNLCWNGEVIWLRMAREPKLWSVAHWVRIQLHATEMAALKVRPKMRKNLRPVLRGDIRRRIMLSRMRGQREGLGFCREPPWRCLLVRRHLIDGHAHLQIHFAIWDKYILQLTQIHLAVEANTFSNLRQMRFIIWENIYVNFG